jgi:hypothetical protein
LKKGFAEDGSIIKHSSPHYVDELNLRIYNTILKKNLEYFEQISFSMLFKSVAILEGDFNNGENKVELLRNWYGEKVLRRYQAEQPDKYRKYFGEGQ